MLCHQNTMKVCAAFFFTRNKWQWGRGNLAYFIYIWRAWAVQSTFPSGLQFMLKKRGKPFFISALQEGNLSPILWHTMVAWLSIAEVVRIFVQVAMAANAHNTLRQTHRWLCNLCCYCVGLICEQIIWTCASRSWEMNDSNSGHSTASAS